MLVFVSGGVRSGKSSYGESLAAEISTGRKIYLATSKPYDEEMSDRIRHHREQRRGKGFVTIEKSNRINEIIEELKENDTVLLDCLGNLLANEMFKEETKKTEDGFTQRIFNDLCEINHRVRNLIIISNDVFSDGCQYSDSVVQYVDELAELHKMIVRDADRAVECVFGSQIIHKYVK